MTKQITMELLSLVFSLPQLVAKDEGYYEEEGVKVSFVPKGYADAGLSYLDDHELVSSFGTTKSNFESGEADLYRACEWGQIRRADDTAVGGRVVSKRAAVGSQAILVRPDSPHVHPSDLAGAGVAVNYHHGSHYLALQSLEGFLPREEIKVVHVGGPQQRFEALRDGRVEAAALMEPWITVAEKQGFKLLSEAFYVGSEIAGPEVDPETYAAVNRAVVRAVHKLNEDPRPYLHHLIGEVPAQIQELTPEDFPLGRLRFVEPAPYPQDQFQRTYDWMVGWGLIKDDAAFEDLVTNFDAEV
ncbi:NitT/TauT family transport system substrate-binding protein [Nocardiopsis flavescens]|uniref:NitT/TauT family transport system substrate-binding protein n=1 Tax=Nocardiopsis flavescens TaxID=758803 RepID=A0A1M6W537_9ACTN|nr:ABC transporter substrate-binding protein [Nocardiopsis flavescens]SHK88880.1 NitT/TauT family transport system substrate-binding protein [Nocardiopsis flavescens]